MIGQVAVGSEEILLGVVGITVEGKLPTAVANGISVTNKISLHPENSKVFDYSF